MVDDEDYKRLNQWKWYALPSRNTYYAARMVRPKKKRILIYMHREIMKPSGNLQIDHKDGNGLNNTRSNLRICTQHQNTLNRKPFGNSNCLGVHFRKIISTYVKKDGKIVYYEYDRYISNITSNGRHKFIGRFKTEEEAGRAYDSYAKELHGEFANLNFKES